jgi:membrane-bound lytic murein transglycosylase D
MIFYLDLKSFIMWSFMRPRLLITLGLVCFLAAGCAPTAQEAQAPPPQEEVKPSESHQAQRPSPAEIQARVADELKALGGYESCVPDKDPVVEEECQVTYDLPITINDQVTHFIDYFQTKIPKRFKIWLARSGRYIPMMGKILKEYGLPEDLVYLAMIESGFSCRAYSRAHAVGPWQFIRGTGKRYGLKIDYWVDERRDPVKATHAAAKYLRDLYQEFGSWYLAAAAYNAGEVKIRRALKRYKADDFWSISQRRRRYLKRETKNYVPKMIAAALIAKEPAKYGFTDLQYEPPLAFDEVKIHPGTSLSLAAKLAGITTRELVGLNPELRRWAAPPTGGIYKLRVPAGQHAAFTAAYASIKPTERRARIGAVKVRVQPGDTMGKLAHSFGVRLGDLLAMNPKLNPRRLRIGQMVYIPPSAQSGTQSRRHTQVAKSSVRRKAAATYAAPHRNQRKLVHVVKKGDNLWDIAQSYGINHRDIMRWNGKHSSSLKVGQKLVLYVPQAKAEVKVAAAAKPAKTLIHRVRKGDSLWTIAQRYKVTPAKLRRWNSLRSNRLNIGDRLFVRLDSNT